MSESKVSLIKVAIINNMSRNIIQSQIQSLRTHPHIKKVQKIDNRRLQLLYYPKDLKCHYAQFQYRIKIELPIKYPQEPPTIKFVDPINHLNISDKTGELVLPMLVQDWSPYISLYIIIDLIDAALMDPELSPRYCVGSEKQAKRVTVKSSIKVQDHEPIINNSKRLEEMLLFNTAECEEISMIKKVSGTSPKEEIMEEELKPIGTMKRKLKRLKTIILQKSQQFVEKHPTLTPSIKLGDEIDKISEQESLVLNENQERAKIEDRKSPRRIKLENSSLEIQMSSPKFRSPRDYNTRDELKQQEKTEENRSSGFKTFAKLQSSSRFEAHTAKKQKSDYKDSDHHSLTSTIYLDNTTKNLGKINRIIQMFTNQLMELERTKSQTKNDYFAKKIEKKMQEQISMIEQLEELSSTVKKTIIQNLKKQIKK